ncbi:GerAB/ArcD/ProY family transporter [Neobacillus drentensis]|uniref:GerAB/ArcD/ProY family transporter n=1 Tax=Neobacillus drentensis TaxID=220684 RepID=UPI0030032677
MAEIYLIILIVLGVLGHVLVLFSGIIDFKNLLPVLGKGWKPVLTAAYPNLLMFPFGEMISFTMIFPFLNKIQAGRKTGVKALMFSAIILSITHAIEISVLGAKIYSRATFPLYSTMIYVNIADFLQRVEVIAILTLIIGVFFKISIYCYAAVIAASDLFKVQTKQKIVVPFGIIVLFLSMMIASDLLEHNEEGKLVVKFILPLFSVVIPVLLLVVHLIRKRLGLYRSNSSEDQQ